MKNLYSTLSVKPNEQMVASENQDTAETKEENWICKSMSLWRNVPLTSPCAESVFGCCSVIHSLCSSLNLTISVQHLRKPEEKQFSSNHTLS